MTFNQVVLRIKTLALAHAQLRNFYYGNVSDFLTDRTTQYASCFLQDTPGSISPGSKVTTLNFKIFLLDLVNVSEDSKANELDVQSDMLSVAEDLLSQFDDSVYTDWRIGSSSPIVFVRDEQPDVTAGVVVDITIDKLFVKDTCAIPE